MDAEEPQFPAFPARFGAGTVVAPLSTPPSPRRQCGRNANHRRGHFMRTRRLLGMVALGLTVLALMAGGAGRALAGPMNPGDGDPLTFNFDENGNGSISVNGGPFQPLQGSLMANPSNTGLAGGLALTYLLP